MIFPINFIKEILQNFKIFTPPPPPPPQKKKTFDVVETTPRETLALCCVDIAQLITHPTNPTLSFSLQLFCKALGILRRITKGQKVYIK